MRTIVLLFLGLAAVSAIPQNPQRIVGGSATTIAQYPNIAALLATTDWSTWWQSCGGIILNTRSVLTAAHCPDGDNVLVWRIRVGSTYGNSGGTVHTLQNYILHPSYNMGIRWNNDIAILRSASTITFVNNAVQAGLIAGPNYYLADNQVVWAAGWGSTYAGGPPSEELRHVQVWTINQNTCSSRYRELGATITGTMVCSGWLDVGSRDQCQGDAGGPLYHNGVVVGITSWGEQCGLPRYPRVNTRVSRFSSWVQSNA